MTRATSWCRSTHAIWASRLTGLFGDPDTTDNLDGSWDHEFASGGDDLPSYTIEVGMPKVPAFFLHAGVSSTRSRSSSPVGPAAATIGAIAGRTGRHHPGRGADSLTFGRISPCMEQDPPCRELDISIVQGRFQPCAALH